MSLWVLLILLAFCGIGMPINFRTKEDFGSEVRIELVEKRKDDKEEDGDEQEKT